jgi:hypothetical protein
MVVPTVLLTYPAYNAGGQSSFTTTSISPSAGKFLLITVMSGTASAVNPNVPTLSGCGLTFTQVNTYLNVIGLSRRITVFRAVAVSPSSGALTVDFAGQNQVGMTILVSEFSGVDTTGTNGSNGIVQSTSQIVANSATSKSITLSALAKPSNVSFGAILTWGYSTSLTPGSGYTELNEIVNTVGGILQNQIKQPGSTTVDWTFAAANDNETGAIALELNAKRNGGIMTLFAGR